MIKIRINDTILLLFLEASSDSTPYHYFELCSVVMIQCTAWPFFNSSY